MGPLELVIVLFFVAIVVTPILLLVLIVQGRRRRRGSSAASWTPEWTLEPTPCASPDTCSPERPTCEPCTAARRAFLADEHDGDWAALADWQRDAWRLEVADG